MRFGHLLDFIKLSVIPQISNSGGGGKKSPLVKIDNDQWNNKMYTLPYQISLDPRVCIVNGVEKINTKDFFPQLTDWKNTDKFKGEDVEGFAWTMNIYISHDQILNSLNSNADDKGNLSLFDFLSSLCTALNKAMGGINNLEPILDEETNTIHIIDSSYAPKRTKPDYGLELFGYNPSFKSSNFVRNTSIKTEITNDFATMATIGSTAGGYIKGTENTMFSKWNKGLIDRFKEKLTPPKSISKNNDDKEAEDDVMKTYLLDFWDKRYSSFGYTLDDNDAEWFGENRAGLSDEIIDKNISIVSEFFKYAHYKIYQKNKIYSSPSNGFIPISLNVTMDGLSGIKIYNEINAVTRFLPSNYPDNLRFIVKGVNHKLQDQDWETSIETMVIAQTDSEKGSLTYAKKKIIMDEIRSTARVLVKEIAPKKVPRDTTITQEGSNNGTSQGTPQGNQQGGQTSKGNPNWPVLRDVVPSKYPHIKYKDGAVGSSKPSQDRINPKLLAGLEQAAISSGVTPTITTAITGHSPGSRHNPSGKGLDIAIVNGLGSGSATNASNGNKQYRIDGNKFKNALVALGYTWNIESGQDKAVLWQTNTGGNHFNHLHVSNRLA
jgi:hypothetical protein